MQTNAGDGQKSIVAELNFGAKTAKRVAWESWEFTVVSPYEVEVTNASYGYLKDDHSYRVMVAETDAGVLPVECECPADQYSEDYDCKHKVALAAIGGPTVLQAAVDFDPTPTPVRADGGCECDAHDFPCFECYRSGRRELPE
ncbi:SWIM family zinc finger [Halapricum desulfuricans]|uniref:SWIM family zinc finger n=1 Tax=Halapricum desulfuricans TaxID=2841257 RepID=A0A897NGB6_9EURY|nr:SWIM zinc finger family protein [Halapricum desulfuricans]QSG11381.1 SWIM family zinc finger [Halapricum desulfuricans]